MENEIICDSFKFDKEVKVGKEDYIQLKEVIHRDDGEKPIIALFPKYLLPESLDKNRVITISVSV